ncbi:MAG: glycosyltransferase family 2 protein [Muribaculaceae bacterium]|nr:glycosyltransferase family 2 protein [Muribaculaceae bacterium]
MKELHIITPVKDSIDTTMETIDAIMASRLTWPHTFTIYNDFSTPENTATLARAAREKKFSLINLSDMTSHASPNYLLILQEAQRKALAADAGLLIVESDVIVAPDTLQRLADEAVQRSQCGIAAAVTVDDEGRINYPYLYAQGSENQVIDSRKHCSFCCSLLTPALLQTFDFGTLDPSKNWYDVTISHASLKLGLKNYLFTNLPVVHHPHASRPWKLLKYKNPLKYYWRKFTRGLDKI